MHSNGTKEQTLAWGGQDRSPKPCLIWNHTMNEQDTNAPPSIHYNSGRSIIIRHTVQLGHRDRYETWLRQIIAAAAQFPGH